MTRNSDIRSVGPSKLVPFRPNEDAQERHGRRFDHALNTEPEVRAWAEKIGVRFSVSNNGQHWRFEKGARVAEWWPSTAKLAFDRNYGATVHVHDWTQAIAEMAREWAT